jgi:hypothetical protein
LNPHTPEGRRVSWLPIAHDYYSSFEEDLERGERPDCSTPALVFPIVFAVKRLKVIRELCFEYRNLGNDEEAEQEDEQHKKRNENKRLVIFDRKKY